MKCYCCGKQIRGKAKERYDYATKKKVKICQSCSKIGLVRFDK